jgi:hypothetical protein
MEVDVTEVLALLREHVMARHAAILAALRRESDFDGLSPREQGRLYNRRIGDSVLSPFLHLARKGKLNPEAMRARFKSARKLMEFAEGLGILSLNPHQESGGP